MQKSLSTAGNLAVLFASFLAAVPFRFLDRPGHFPTPGRLALLAGIHVLVYGICLYYAGVLDGLSAGGRLDQLLRQAQALLVGTGLLAVLYFLLPNVNPGRLIVLLYILFSLVGLAAYDALIRWLLGQRALCHRLLILGTGQTAGLVVREMLRQDSPGLEIVGLLAERASEVSGNLTSPPTLGTIEDLTSVIEKEHVNLVIVALDDRRGRMPVAKLLRHRFDGLRVEEAASFVERRTGKIMIAGLRPSWFVFSDGFRKPHLILGTKRLAEAALAGLMLVLAAPVMATVALLVKLGSRGPVFYRQVRVGEGGREFHLVKFRTMKVDAEDGTGPVWTSTAADPRVTWLGRFMRRTRLDELPQLVNVARGDMSFVGPRPERPHFVEKLEQVIPYYRERHSVKPGITGWAQVRFGYGSTIEDAEEKLQYDLYYIKNMSPILDAAILFDTVKTVVMGKGAR